MITQRPLAPEDRELLAKTIAADEYHPDVNPNFYYSPNTIGIVYSDEDGPIAYMRLASALKINMQFCDVNPEKIRRLMVTQFPDVINRAKKNGYCQIVFKSASRALRLFCIRYLGFGPPEEQVLWIEAETPKTSLESTVCVQKKILT